MEKKDNIKWQLYDILYSVHSGKEYTLQLVDRVLSLISETHVPLECQGFCTKKGMREKIAKVNYESFTGMSWDKADEQERKGAYVHTNKLLSITHDDWEMVEGCPMCLGESPTCAYCKDTGEITRPATIDEILNNPNVRRKG